MSKKPVKLSLYTVHNYVYDAICDNNFKRINDFLNDSTYFGSRIRSTILDDYTLLSSAIQGHCNYIARLFINNGMAIDYNTKFPSEEHSSPLVQAIKFQNIAMLKLLIKHGIKFNNTTHIINIDNKGVRVNTTLYFTILTNNPEIISLVVLAGCNTEHMCYYVLNDIVETYHRSYKYFSSGRFKTDIIARTKLKNAKYRHSIKAIFKNYSTPLGISSILDIVLDFSEYDIPSRTLIEDIDGFSILDEFLKTIDLEIAAT